MTAIDIFLEAGVVPIRLSPSYDRGRVAMFTDGEMFLIVTPEDNIFEYHFRYGAEYMYDMILERLQK